MSRDFSLSAEPAGDPVGRSIRLLSQGAADQLYLAVRSARKAKKSGKCIGCSGGCAGCVKCDKNEEKER